MGFEIGWMFLPAFLLIALLLSFPIASFLISVPNGGFRAFGESIGLAILALIIWTICVGIASSAFSGGAQGALSVLGEALGLFVGGLVGLVPGVAMLVWFSRILRGRRTKIIDIDEQAKRVETP